MAWAVFSARRSKGEGSSLNARAICAELDEVGEAVVARVQGPVPGGYKVYVSAAVGRDLLAAQLHALHDRIPHRGIVHATLPGVADVYQTFPFWVAFPVEVLVPSFQLGEVVFEERSDCCLVLSVSVDVQHRCCVNGRLDNT